MGIPRGEYTAKPNLPGLGKSGSVRMQVAYGRVRRKTKPTGPGVGEYTAKPNLPGLGLEAYASLFYFPDSFHHCRLRYGYATG